MAQENEILLEENETPKVETGAQEKPPEEPSCNQFDGEREGTGNKNPVLNPLHPCRKHRG